MPLALDPNQTCMIVLESDQDKPKADQPYFTYRFLTGRQCFQINDALDKIESVKDSEVFKTIYSSAATGLVGWGNMIAPATGAEIAFDAEKLDDIVSISEALELCKTITQQFLSRADKKKLNSPSGSASASAAKTVRARKNAKTSPRKPRR